MPLFDSSIGDVTDAQVYARLSPSLAKMPNVSALQAGGSTGYAKQDGTLYVTTSAGVSPGTTATHNVLAAYTIPAGAFDVAGRGIALFAQGSLAATANNKQIRIYAGCTTAVVGSAVTGGTVIADTGVVTTSGAGWALSALLYKYGAAGSNTQIALHQSAQAGSAVSSLAVPAALTLTESATILVCVTGNATTVVTDILMNLFCAEWYN